MTLALNRRELLRATLGLAAGAATMSLAGPLLGQKAASALRLTLLHTNDIHSHLDPAKEGEFIGLGGAPARSALVNAFRRTQDNVLLFDCGDVFQGTPYFNLYGGEPEFKTMSAMAYDAGTLGNHDFDNGTQALADMVSAHVRFPMLNGNYGLDDTPLAGLTRETLVLERGGLRIGLLGLGIKLAGLVSPRLTEGVVYRDPIADARRMATHLREEEKCELVIALSHVSANGRGTGADRDPGDRDILAAVPEIDIILGGHNHWLFPEPEFYTRANAAPQLLNQAGWAGTHLGRLTLDVYERGKYELRPSWPAVAGPKEY